MSADERERTPSETNPTCPKCGSSELHVVCRTDAVPPYHTRKIMKLDDISEMAKLIEEARKLPPMTDEQRREQAASFAFGQIALTKEWADADAFGLLKLRAMCRRLAGCSGSTCTKPPPGWTCAREPGHDGPCAASRKLRGGEAPF